MRKSAPTEALIEKGLIKRTTTTATAATYIVEGTGEKATGKMVIATGGTVKKA